MDHIVVDVEIQKTIEELPGKWADTHLMGVGVAVVYEFQSDRFRIYGPDDVGALRLRLIAADRISGFNIIAFDFPVIFGLPKTQTTTEGKAMIDQLSAKSNDILDRIWKSLRGREKGWALDPVAKATLGVGKIGNGADAPKWFQAGLHHKVTNYCIDDVSIERDLAVFVDKYGFVRNETRSLELGKYIP